MLVVAREDRKGRIQLSDKKYARNERASMQRCIDTTLNYNTTEIWSIGNYN